MAGKTVWVCNKNINVNTRNKGVEIKYFRANRILCYCWHIVNQLICAHNQTCFRHRPSNKHHVTCHGKYVSKRKTEAKRWGPKLIN